MFKLIIVIISTVWWNTDSNVKILDTEIWFTMEDECIEAGVKVITEAGSLDDETEFRYICLPDANGSTSSEWRMK